jgi:hypothetical protein
MLTLNGSPASLSVSAPLVGVEANVPEAVNVMIGAVPVAASSLLPLPRL